MKHPGRTPPFRGPTGELVPGSIAEINYLRLGGLDQWVMIRGESLANPPLILLHGGPGLSEMRFFRQFNAPLEQSFTVAVYIGSEQCGDWPAAESSSCAFALAEAQRLNDRKALEELRAIAPPPHTASSLWTVRTSLQRFEGQLRARAAWNMGRIVLGRPESSVFDLPNIWRGGRFSLDAMWAEVSKLNLLKAAPALQMAVFFFLGRRDHWVPEKPVRRNSTH